MERLLEFGRKAIFYVRILSGYEERRIRSFRLQLEKHVQQAEERKAALRKIPEQVILAEVRRMVEEMQNLNKKLDETEAAIEEYFKPIDKEVGTLMKIQLEGEEKTMRDMMKVMQQQALLENSESQALLENTESQALLEKTESNKTTRVHDIDANQNQDPASSNAPMKLK